MTKSQSQSMENLYIIFNVKVSDEEYSYRGKQGEAELKIRVPRATLGHIDPGNLLVGVMQAALVDFDEPEPEPEPDSKDE